MTNRFTPEPARVEEADDTAEVKELSRESIVAECIQRLQVILDHFTEQAEREEFQGWVLDGRGRLVRSGVTRGASPASFWHDSKLHEAMNGNDPSCEVYLNAMWVMDRLKEFE